MRLFTVCFCFIVACHKGKVEVIDHDGDQFLGDDDCDDYDPEVFPGALDVPYDGVDSDCMGDDDFDQDGDGFSSADYGGTDCDDQQALVNPDQTEIPYNNIDDDCSPLTPDDDLDGDGFNQLLDCDDSQAAVHPGAVEIFANGVDEDCSGDADNGVWRYEVRTSLDTPSEPFVAYDQLSAHIGIAAKSSTAVYNYKTQVESFGVAFIWSTSWPLFGLTELAPLSLYHGEFSQPLDQVMVAASGPEVWVASAFHSEVSGLAILETQALRPDGSKGDVLAGYGPPDSISDIDLSLESSPTTVACGAGGLNLLTTTGSGFISEPFDHCYLALGSQVAVGCGGGVCQAYSLVNNTLVVDSAVEEDWYIDAHTDNGLLIGKTAAGAVEIYDGESRWTLPAGTKEASALTLEDGTLVVAMLQGAGQVVVSYGPGDNLQEVPQFSALAGATSIRVAGAGDEFTVVVGYDASPFFSWAVFQM